MSRIQHVAAAAIFALTAGTVLPQVANAQDSLTPVVSGSSITATKEAAIAPYINQYVYAADGSVAGILHHLRGSDQAVIAVSRFTGAAPWVAVPVANLDVVNGHVVIRSATFASLEKQAEAN